MRGWLSGSLCIWRLNSKTHNDLLHHINNCLPIEILLEKRCIKFIYNIIINSEHSLHSRIALYQHPLNITSLDSGFKMADGTGRHCNYPNRHIMTHIKQTQ